MEKKIATKRHKIHKLILCVLCLFVASLLSASAQTNNSRDALFTAIQRGSIADVERLLKTGVSAGLTDAEGTPALMAAALFADARIMELLLQHGADANQPGPSGTTALMWAVPDLAITEAVSQCVEHCSHLATGAAHCSLDRIGRRRQRDKCRAIRKNTCNDSRCIRNRKYRHPETLARSRRGSECKDDRG